MKRILATAVTTAILAGPAYSQGITSQEKTPLQLKYEREELDRRQNEQEYNETMKRLKAQPPAATKSDPWAGVRPAPETRGKR